MKLPIVVCLLGVILISGCPKKPGRLDETSSAVTKQVVYSGPINSMTVSVTSYGYQNATIDTDDKTFNYQSWTDGEIKYPKILDKSNVIITELKSSSGLHGIEISN